MQEIAKFSILGEKRSTQFWTKFWTKLIIFGRTKNDILGEKRSTQFWTKFWTKLIIFGQTESDILDIIFVQSLLMCNYSNIKKR